MYSTAAYQIDFMKEEIVFDWNLINSKDSKSSHYRKGDLSCSNDLNALKGSQ